MPKHADDDQVLFGYASSRNISFQNEHNRDEIGYTWGEWREMSEDAKDEALQEYLNDLVEVFVVEDED